MIQHSLNSVITTSFYHTGREYIFLLLLYSHVCLVLTHCLDKDAGIYRIVCFVLKNSCFFIFYFCSFLWLAYKISFYIYSKFIITEPLVIFICHYLWWILDSADEYTRVVSSTCMYNIYSSKKMYLEHATFYVSKGQTTNCKPIEVRKMLF